MSRCWCCGDHLGDCQCQDEITVICMGCQHCNEHCQCKKLGISEEIREHIKNNNEEIRKRFIMGREEGIPGVGPEAPTAVNHGGGKQSDSPYRSDLLPPKALLRIAAVLKRGAEKYGDQNWRNIPRADHINHVLTHLLAFLAGDQQDDHLQHAACRILMALESQ